MASHVDIKSVNIRDLHFDQLPPAAHRSFLYCTKLSFLRGREWYLAGGTALALQVGHRRSIDLDFFTPRKNFQETLLEQRLLETGQWKTSFRQKGTLYGVLLEAKVSFIAYPFFIPSHARVRYGNIKILIPSDIAAMKIIAISQRGRKRDFIDLYWYCINREPLEEILERSIRQYPGQENNVNHILRSLVYFDDADQDPMPKLFFKATWPGIKKYFRTEVPRVAKKFLGLS